MWIERPPFNQMVVSVSGDVARVEGVGRDEVLKVISLPDIIYVDYLKSNLT